MWITCWQERGLTPNGRSVIVVCLGTMWLVPESKDVDRFNGEAKSVSISYEQRDKQ